MKKEIEKDINFPEENLNNLEKSMQENYYDNYASNDPNVPNSTRNNYLNNTENLINNNNQVSYRNHLKKNSTNTSVNYNKKDSNNSNLEIIDKNVNNFENKKYEYSKN